MTEVEGKGVDFERYALDKLFTKLKHKLGIETVIEVPAGGEKAMPSIYSLSFGRLGCNVTLVNAEPKSRWAWERLGYPVNYFDCDDVASTGLDDLHSDLVWNFISLSQREDPVPQLREMIRLSRRYIMFIGVNKFNPGFLSHRMVHRVYDIPWSHGDVRFMDYRFVSQFFKDHCLNIVQCGVVDTPPYPDSVGFRDLRLHRMNVDLRGLDWDSRSIAWMESGQYPLKIRLLYLFERLPLPLFLKRYYAHLSYVIAEKPQN
jgi:hypothetical protein